MGYISLSCDSVSRCRTRLVFFYSGAIRQVGRIMAVTVATILLYTGRGIESLLIGNSIMYVFVHVVSLICIWRIARIQNDQ